MRLIFYPDAWDDYLEWQTNDRKGAQTSQQTHQGNLPNPYEGIGKPEALKGDLEGYWSRRVDGEHRLVYKVEGDALLIAQCRRHY